MPRAGSCSCSRHERTARPGRYGAAKPGETFVVSAASGVTGALAKQHGRRVVGITGSPEKGAWLRELGFGAAVDRTTGDLGEALREVCPDGIDVYFDHVGGAVLDAALGNLALFGRVAVCGLLSVYDRDEPAPGPARFDQILMAAGPIED
ncbi:zinc-binding dehydrogenase [Amycolatopsis thermoflava]|uniref:zinc-binding dehydrogenase n=1 Tax=Amycolatopsis thermoflava TaxID=84480 RepID=UPI000F4C5ACB|nr:zinc-binding dehydrogenase [Amycolatopsis thermoflava]